MSFEQGRDETIAAAVTSPALETAGSYNDSELPLPPKNEPQTPKTEIDSETRERLEHVLQSDIGISTLLNRLKQSISSARDFSAFLKERSTIEEKHAQGLKKLSRSTHEIIRRPESKGGSFAYNFEEITKIHERIADNGLQFANSLYQMHEELQELTTKSEHRRKHLKQTGLDAEKRVQDAEGTMTKAKSKYNTLAEQYDGVRTGERQSGKFGRNKNEDELKRKLDTADGEYASRVQAAQASRQELLSTHRPQAVRQLEETIRECDAGLTLQLQKYAALNEKLLLGNGLAVSPLKSQTNGIASSPKSLREVVYNINDQKDLHEYVLGFTNRAGTNPPEIKYQQHPSLAPKQQQQTQPPPTNFNPSQSQSQFGTPERSNTFNPYDRGHRSSESGQISGVMPYQPAPGDRLPSGPPPAQYQSGPPPPNTYNSSQAPQLPQIGAFSESGSRPDLISPVKSPAEPRSGPLHGPSRSDQFTSGPSNGYGPSGPGSQDMGSGRGGPPGPGYQQDHRGPSMSGVPIVPPMSGVGQPGSRGPSLGQSSDFQSAGPNAPHAQPSYQQQQYQPGPRGPPANASGPPDGVSGGFRPSQPQPSNSFGPGAGAAINLPSQQRRADVQRQNLLPVKPVFGVPLDELFRRDGSAVPHIVFRCIEAVDLHGLDQEGIYRTSGSAPVIMELKAQFDHDASQIDFRNPAAYKNDVASVTTLLKHFLRDLPDPLLTTAAYSQFIQAAQIDDDHMRRDSLHAIINSLPDPNYATLRVLALHLNRVAAHADRNRMTPQNIAICFGPTLMGHTGKEAQSDIKDAGWQARVVETILSNTLQIFDDDE